MANKTFSRKRKPAGLTTSYELKDHMVATNQQGSTTNPHPQYVLRSEVVSGGGDSNLTLHMSDPNAHSNYYVQIADVTHSYNYSAADQQEKVTSAKAVYDFYQIFLAHNHDQTYLNISHETDQNAHKGLFAKIADIEAHNGSDEAHPNRWVDKEHVITMPSEIPEVIDHRHVPGYLLHSQLSDKVDSLTSAVKDSGDYIIGPAANNPLAPIFAPIIHTHTYANVGAAPEVHYHDERYSLVDHDHDERYSLIHSHPYLSDTALETVGIYPSMALTTITKTENPDYDPEDESSEQYLYEPPVLNDMVTQGWYAIKDEPVDAPYATVIINDSNRIQLIGRNVIVSMVASNGTYVNNSDVLLSPGNIDNYYHLPVKIKCTVGMLEVRTVSNQTEDGSELTATKGLYQVYTDITGAVLQRAGTSATVTVYTLTVDETVQEGIDYYGLESGVYTKIENLVVGSAIPADTYYVESGTEEVHYWSDWTEVGVGAVINNGLQIKPEGYALALGNRTHFTQAVACNCCYSKTSGYNYLDFIIPAAIKGDVNKLTAEFDVLLICNVTNSTYGYSKGDVIVNPIVSNKANNESSFLGHVQTAIMTVGANKVIRMFLPLVWYVKVADAVAESNVKITTSNVHKYYRRTFTYPENGTSKSVVIDASTATSVNEKTGTIAAITYGSKTIPVATQAECGEWVVRVRMKY
jgi:hypothetical protein